MLVKADRYEKRRKRIAARPHKHISYLSDVNKFEVKYPIGKDENGKRMYFMPIKRYDEIKDALERKDEIERMIFGRLLRDKKITMSDIFNNVIKMNVSRTGGTIKIYKNLNEAFNNSDSVAVKELWTNTNITDITSEKMGEAFNALVKEKKWKKSTARNYKTVLTTATRAEETRNFIRGVAFFTENITDFKLTIKAKTELNSKNHYDMQELHKILKELDGIKGEAGLIFKIQIATGARIGEICGLIADDIKDGIIYFNNQISLTDSKERVPLKTGDIRFTPISKSIEEDIQKRIKDLNISGEDFLFKSRWRNAQRLRLIDIFTKCGIKIIEGRSTHGFRRSLTTFVKGSMLERGVISDSINFERYIGHKVEGIPEMYNKSYKEKVSKERFKLIIEQYLNAIRKGDEVFRIDYEDIENKLYNKTNEPPKMLPQIFVNNVLKLAEEYGVKM